MGAGAAVDAETRARLAGARVLLVEDNPLNQEIALFMLAGFGLQIDVADHGRMALDMLFKTGPDSYDLVFMDMQMPVMDGVAATVELRRRDGFVRLPVVAMTANALPEDRRACLAAGMDDFVAKPISPASLKPVLVRWIRPPSA